MNMSLFTVTLHHLSPDVKRVGVEYPDGELSQVTEKRLRELIASLAAVGAREHKPASPELRIAAPHGRFVIQVVEGRLRFNSWTIRVGGASLTPDQIFAIVTGTDDPAAAARAADAFMQPAKRSSWGKIALIGALILGTNGTTAWMLLRPPPPNPFLPEYKLLEAQPAERLLTDAAGEYLTGTGEGHRGMRLTRDGRLHSVKFGPQGTVVEESDLTVKAAQSKGRPALFTSNEAVIEIIDPSTLVLFGDTYRRKVQ
mgnify:CR=1 FL=1